MKPHSKFKLIYILKKEREAVAYSFPQQYRPQFYVRTLPGVTGEIQLPEGVEMVMPGDNVTIQVELIYPVACVWNIEFRYHEGGHVLL